MCQLVEDVLVGCGEVWQECHTPSDIRALETRHLEAGLTNALSHFRENFYFNFFFFKINISNFLINVQEIFAKNLKIRLYLQNFPVANVFFFFIFFAK